ncbi:MAG: VCBS repeat-containing protein [Planctomycetes bacterium]|nr:VCBS repeat-containing protein [Planctomycetota bacterium]
MPPRFLGESNMMKTSLLATTLLLAATATAQGHWWVSPSGNDADPGTQAQPFQTINFAAATATAGDVIHLVAGTFGNEQNHVQLGTKNLTLVGAGVGLTIVKAHSSTDIMLPAGTLASPTSETHRCSIALQGSARVDLRDMTLDQGFSMPSSGRGYCLWIGGGADSECDNVEFTNARANPINGIQGPLGVNVRGDGTADTTNLTMRNCLVHEYGKGGVVANYDAHLVMDDCRVDGFNHAWLGLAAQNCVQVSRGATCELRRCTITDSWYDPTSVVATGILIYEPGPSIVIEDCNLGNCQVGIYVFALSPMATTGVIARNRIATAQYGFYVLDVSGLTVTGNSFGCNFAGSVDDAWDDGSGNTYAGNWYSSVTSAGPHTLPGTAGSSDATAMPYVNGFGTAVATALPAGYSPVDLAVGDFDGDGKVDFAALCLGPTPSLAIGTNTGAGFSVVNIPFGSSAGQPVALAVGEFNGAAGPDVAVLTANVPPSLTENKVWVFGNDTLGNLSLAHTHTIAGATAPSGIAAADVDGDGVDDVAFSDAGSAGFIPGSAGVLVNNGTGTGFAAVALTAAYTAACRDVTLGDLDGDTDIDVAVVEGDATSGKLHLFAGDGLGGFTAFGASPLTLSNNPQQALAADVEGDGDVDVLVTSTRDAFGLDAGGVDALINDGAGAFTSSLYWVDRGPTALAAGDLDKDADPDTLRLDAVCANPIAGSVSVLGGWNDFGPGSGGIAVAGALPVAVAIADTSGDGVGDLLYADAAAGTVVVVPGVPTARVDRYGAGSAGTSGRVPDLYPVGAPALPTQPNATFGLGLRNARPLAIAVIAAGLSPLPITPGGLLINDIGATWLIVTNVQGRAAVPLPFPATPLVLGFPIYCQAGVFDANGTEAFFPGIATTNGLKIRIGQ